MPTTTNCRSLDGCAAHVVVADKLYTRAELVRPDVRYNRGDRDRVSGNDVVRDHHRLLAGAGPVLETHVPAIARVEPTCDIADGVHLLVTDNPHGLVTNHTTSRGELGADQFRVSRTGTHSCHNQVGGELPII